MYHVDVNESSRFTSTFAFTTPLLCRSGSRIVDLSPDSDLGEDFVPSFDLRYLGARALCAQSPGVFVNIRWNLSLPNPVRVKTSLTLTLLAALSGTPPAHLALYGRSNSPT